MLDTAVCILYTPNKSILQNSSLHPKRWGLAALKVWLMTDISLQMLVVIIKIC